LPEINDLKNTQKERTSPIFSLKIEVQLSNPHRPHTLPSKFPIYPGLATNIYRVHEK